MMTERLVWVSPPPVPPAGWGAAEPRQAKIPPAAVTRWLHEACALGDGEADEPSAPPCLHGGDAQLSPRAALHRARWEALQDLKWGLRSDREVCLEDALAFFAQAGPGPAKWMEAQARALAEAHPSLAKKSTALRLHFVALGEEWFRALLDNPSLAAFLESENQAVDLEKVLAATRPLFAPR